MGMAPWGWYVLARKPFVICVLRCYADPRISLISTLKQRHTPIPAKKVNPEGNSRDKNKSGCHNKHVQYPENTCDGDSK